MKIDKKILEKEIHKLESELNKYGFTSFCYKKKIEIDTSFNKSKFYFKTKNVIVIKAPS